LKSYNQYNKLKVTHIFHSGVIVETEKNLLIIDYYYEKDALNKKELLVYLKQQAHKDFYYFVTHGHADHFTDEIFDPPYQSSKSNTRYILSEDLVSYKNSHPNTTLCRPYQSFNVGGLSITTFGSTDLGVSYLIKDNSCDALIFHSGDLNWWHWSHFTPDEQLQEKKDFLEELQKLKDYIVQRKVILDIAFVPVDPRLKEFYQLAANAFLKEIQPKKMFPLHFREHYKITKKFKEQCSVPDKFESVAHSMETYSLQD